ncbi:MAG: Sporulation initiation inhibitor protein Soj [Chlamydiae bacterium]|nr:Sporulation initiation inhibitor protein Soj [Chlamydiota bacterium]
MSKKISVCSFKGGTAKTSCTLNLGAGFAKFHKKKVLLVDFDAQANLTTGLGYNPDQYDSLAKVLLNEKQLHEVILHTQIKNLDLIPADSFLERVELLNPLAQDRYSHEKLSELLKPLKYDIIIIDTPPSLCWLTESALIASDYSLICATAEFYSIKGLERLKHFLDGLSKRHPTQILGVLLSFWNQRGKNNKAFLDLIKTTFPKKLIDQKIRRDITVSEASIYGKPIFDSAPTSRAAHDYKTICKELNKRLSKGSIYSKLF